MRSEVCRTFWNRKLPLIAEGDAWAPNRDTGQIPLGTPFKVGVDRDRDVLGVDIEGTLRRIKALGILPS